MTPVLECTRGFHSEGQGIGGLFFKSTGAPTLRPFFTNNFAKQSHRA
jgi:hypothetical protein